MFALTAMRALAILLITNSHLREMHKVQFLATGGMLGNCLFFFISGFGITLGLTTKPREGFTPWYMRRLTRIYAPLVLVTLVFIVFGYKQVPYPNQVGELFLYPVPYWFIPAIAIFYVPSYLLALYATERQIIVAFGILIAVYFGLYEKLVDMMRWDVEDHIVVKSVFYFMTMLSGLYACKFHRSDNPKSNGVVALVVATVAYYGVLAVLKESQDFRWQFLAEAIALGWTVSLYRCLRYESTAQWLDAHCRIPIVFLSRITLEMYLLQEVLYSRPIFSHIVYPINVLCFFAVLIVLAWLLSNAFPQSTGVERQGAVRRPA